MPIASPISTSETAWRHVCHSCFHYRHADSTIGTQRCDMSAKICQPTRPMSRKRRARRSERRRRSLTRARVRRGFRETPSWRLSICGRGLDSYARSSVYPWRPDRIYRLDYAVRHKWRQARASLMLIGLPERVRHTRASRVFIQGLRGIPALARVALGCDVRSLAHLPQRFSSGHRPVLVTRRRNCLPRGEDVRNRP
jgi:hypothetical protein